jgi:uncharacterized membrane protein YccF (DUF307 family)
MITVRGVRCNHLCTPTLADVGVLRTVLNIAWLLLVGWASALTFAVAAPVMAVLVVTIPFAVASWRIALYTIWPFGRTVVSRPTAGVGSAVGNVLWFVLAGLWIFLGHVAAAVGLFITIIGIPFGIATFKIGLLALAPLGKDVVPTDRLGLVGR